MIRCIFLYLKKGFWGNRSIFGHIKLWMENKFFSLWDFCKSQGFRELKWHLCFQCLKRASVHESKDSLYILPNHRGVSCYLCGSRLSLFSAQPPGTLCDCAIWENRLACSALPQELLRRPIPLKPITYSSAFSKCVSHERPGSPQTGLSPFTNKEICSQRSARVWL